MADEELDAGLVERACGAAYPQWNYSVQLATAGTFTERALTARFIAEQRASICRALLSLPIPAAALNALARGEIE